MLRKLSNETLVRAGSLLRRGQHAVSVIAASWIFDEGGLCEGVIATNPAVVDVGHACHARVDVGIVVDWEHLRVV